MNENQISVTDISKAYKKRKVVDKVSLSVNAGKIIGLLGPNGAGKTTCFYMIVGLIPSDEGSIELNNQAITQAPMHLRAKLGLGYLPQEASIFRKLTVFENILAPLQIQADFSQEAAHDRVQFLMQEFHLEHVKDSLGLSLSGGERRRVELARALATSPKFILLDEPFAGVDPISVVDIKQYIQKLKAMNIGVLITDHNVRETLSICDNAYIIAKGQVLAQGSPKQILENQDVRNVYLGSEFKL